MDTAEERVTVWWTGAVGVREAARPDPLHLLGAQPGHLAIPVKAKSEDDDVEAEPNRALAALEDAAKADLRRRQRSGYRGGDRGRRCDASVQKRRPGLRRHPGCAAGADRGERAPVERSPMQPARSAARPLRCSRPRSGDATPLVPRNAGPRTHRPASRSRRRRCCAVRRLTTISHVRSC
jgi:hypothetical protein